MNEMTKIELAPSETLSLEHAGSQVLLIACGALAREIVDLVEANEWKGFDIQCLPAKWHNTPNLIVPGVREKIAKARGRYQKIYVLYGDCGTGGQLDALLQEEGIERIDGPHCYAFFSGNAAFAKRTDADMTAFFLTDYLARHFDKLIWEGLGLHKHPELLPDYFGNYTKIVYLAQTNDEALVEKSRRAAEKLGLAFEYRFTGYGELASELKLHSAP
jgi:Protein of unknown function (DUF1638)